MDDLYGEESIMRGGNIFSYPWPFSCKILGTTIGGIALFYIINMYLDRLY